MFLPALKIAVVAAAVIAITALIASVIKTLRRGQPELHSEPQGSVAKGVSYALGKGMLPWEKESAAHHLGTYFGGVLYHIGIFSAALYALSVVAAIALPSPMLLVLRIGLAAGLVAGVSLFVKRAAKPHLRWLSCPDDYASNLLVDAVLLLALINTFSAGVTWLFLLATILLLLYMPMGKIRHCFYFFYSRVLFGAFFGRRGVLPHDQHRKRALNHGTGSELG